VFIGLAILFGIVAPMLGIIVAAIMMLLTVAFAFWNHVYVEFLRGIDIHERISSDFKEIYKLYDTVCPGKMRVCGDLPPRCRDIICNHFV